MTKTNSPKCYRAGLLAALARCAPGCRAYIEAAAALATFDAEYEVRS